MLYGVVSEEVVVDTLYEGIFRTYYNHINAFLHGESGNAVKVVGFECGHILTYTGSTSITGSDKEFFNFAALSNFPGKGMFATATAEQEDFHKFEVMRFEVVRWEYKSRMALSPCS